MADSLEAHMSTLLGPRKRQIEHEVAGLLPRLGLTNRQKFLLSEVLDNARLGLFSEAEVGLEQLGLPDSAWSKDAIVTDAMVEGINREVLWHRLGELQGTPPQFPPVLKDFAAWSARQGALLRRVAVGELLGNEEVDWGNVIEEIETLGRSQRNELANRVRTVLDHLLRLETSPAPNPRAGWRTTIAESRAEIQSLLDDSPSLRPLLDDIIAKELPRARDIAATALGDYGEQPRIPLDQLHYTQDQVLGPWLPPRLAPVA